jgi:hypothetical protein
MGYSPGKNYWFACDQTLSRTSMQEFYERNESPRPISIPDVGSKYRIENTWLTTSVIEILWEMSRFSWFSMLERS